MRRSQRIVAITKALVEQPYRVFQLREFAELFNSAKSTISEDIAIIKETLLELNNGRIETLHGVSGGSDMFPTYLLPNYIDALIILLRNYPNPNVFYQEGSSI